MSLWLLPPFSQDFRRIFISYLAKVPNCEHVVSHNVQMASAMAYMHANNVLHGDLTASNVLLVPSDPLSTAGRGFSTRVSCLILALDLQHRLADMEDCACWQSALPAIP